MALLPLIPIGVMSNFHTGNSTVAQRVWLMAWLAVGTVFVPAPYYQADTFVESAYSTLRVIRDKGYSSGPRALVLFVRLVSKLLLLAFFTPAIGGFVVVGQVLVDDGSCTGI